MASAVSRFFCGNGLILWNIDFCLLKLEGSIIELLESIIVVHETFEMPEVFSNNKWYSRNVNFL